ncbi:unnamed protein product [Closterium sp. NIES-53]
MASRPPPPKPWERAQQSTGAASSSPFAPSAPAASTSQVVAEAGTAGSNPLTSADAAAAGRPMPSRPWEGATTAAGASGVSPYGSSAYGTPASTAGGAYLGANRYGSGMSSLYGGGGMYGAGGTAYGSAYSSPYASRLGGGYGGYGAGAGGYGAGGMYGSSYGMGGMGGYGSSLGGGMYGSGMTMGGMGGGMYGSGMGMGMGMGYGGEMGMGPHGGDPNAPPDGQGPPRAPTFWVSMLRVIHGVMTGFGRLCVLVDENTHAIHFFITALLQLCDRAGLLYGEVARFVLRLLGFRTPPSQRPKGLPPAPDAALLRGAPAAGAPAGSAPAAFSAPAKTAFSGAAVAVPAGGAAAGGPVGLGLSSPFAMSFAASSAASSAAICPPAAAFSSVKRAQDLSAQPQARRAPLIPAASASASASAAMRRSAPQASSERAKPRRARRRVACQAGSGRWDGSGSEFPNPADLPPKAAEEEARMDGESKAERIRAEARKLREEEAIRLYEAPGAAPRELVEAAVAEEIGVGGGEGEGEGEEQGEGEGLVKKAEASRQPAAAVGGSRVIQGALSEEREEGEVEEVEEEEEEGEVEEEEEEEEELEEGEVEEEGEDEEELYEEDEEEEEEDEEEEDDEEEEEESFDMRMVTAMAEAGEEGGAGALTLAEILEDAGVEALDVDGDLSIEITGIQADSREVKAGDLFVCVVGQTTDGHMYVGDAAERGAAAVVLSRGDVEVDERVDAVVQVEDTQAVLSALAGAFYDHPSEKLAMVGLTGTNGKTTTTYLIKSIYEAMKVPAGLLGTISYKIKDQELEAPNTTPDAISLQRLLSQMVEAGCEACVMEVSSHALTLGRVEDIDFDVAVFTNLTRDHLDFHGTMEAYRDAKARLFDAMTDPTRHRKVGKRQWESQSTLRSVPSSAPTGPSLSTQQGDLEISSGLLGRHNVSNILAAVAVGIAVNVPLEALVRGLEEVDAVPGRAELVDEEQAFAVIVDYAHTPDALSRLLDTVRECGPRRIITGGWVGGLGGCRAMPCRAVPGRAELVDEELAFVVVVDYAHTLDALSRLLDTVRECGPRRIIIGGSSVELVVVLFSCLVDMVGGCICLSLFPPQFLSSPVPSPPVPSPPVPSPPVPSSPVTCSRSPPLPAFPLLVSSPSLPPSSPDLPTQSHQHIAAEKSDVTILTSDNPRTEDPLGILDDMLAGVGWSMEEYIEYNQAGFIPPLPSGNRLYVYDIRGIAVRAAIAMADDGDAVVVAGKGHETYQIVGQEKTYFDDREECREALQHVDELRTHFDTSQLPWRILDMSDMKVIPDPDANAY